MNIIETGIVSKETDKIEGLSLENGRGCEIFFPKGKKESLNFFSDKCEFSPVGWSRIDGVWYPLGYKVVTSNLRSLGLRRNPNIMTFSIGEWALLPDYEVEDGKGDWGGIWTALRRGSIKTLKTHCKETWGIETRAFLTAIHNPVFANSYRIKSQGVMLLQEV